MMFAVARSRRLQVVAKSATTGTSPIRLVVDPGDVPGRRPITIVGTVRPCTKAPTTTELS